MWESFFASSQLDNLAPRRFRFAFRHSPQNWKHRFIASVAFQVGQIDEQIRLPLHRFGYGWPEIRPSSSLELKTAQQLRALTAGIVIDLVNVGVADDQA